MVTLTQYKNRFIRWVLTKIGKPPLVILDDNAFSLINYMEDYEEKYGEEPF